MSLGQTEVRHRLPRTQAASFKAPHLIPRWGSARSVGFLHDVGSGKRLAQVPVALARDKWIENLAFRDADRLLVFDELPFVRTLDLRTGKEVITGGGHHAAVTALAFTGDGKALVSVDDLGRLIRWDAEKGRQLNEMETAVTDALDALPTSAGRALSLSANGHAAIVSENIGVSKGELTFLDPRQGRPSWHERDWPAFHPYPGAREGFIDFRRPPPFCAVSPDGSLIAMRHAGNPRGKCRVEVRRASGARVWEFDSFAGVEQAFSCDSRELALTHSQQTTVVRLMDLQTGKLRLTLSASAAGDVIHYLAYSPDGRFVLATDDHYAYVWERASGKRIERAALPKGLQPHQVVMARGDRLLVVEIASSVSDWLSLTETCVVWDASARKRLLEVSLASGCPVALCAQGRTLAMARADATIALYRVPLPAQAKPFALDRTEQARLWLDLEADPQRAWRARLRLTAAPDDATALFRRHLQPAPQKTIEEVADLDDDDFDVRETATLKLAGALNRGDRAVEMALRDALASAPLERRLRARRLLEQAKLTPFTAEELRLIRAVGVLEQIGDGEAKALLKRLAQGGPSLLTSEARAALARLGK